MIKTALLGHGYWGSKLERYIKENKNFDLVHICNSKTDMSRSLSRFPYLRLCPRLRVFRTQ